MGGGDGHFHRHTTTTTGVFSHPRIPHPHRPAMDKYASGRPYHLRDMRALYTFFFFPCPHRPATAKYASGHPYPLPDMPFTFFFPPCPYRPARAKYASGHPGRFSAHKIKIGASLICPLHFFFPHLSPQA